MFAELKKQSTAVSAKRKKNQNCGLFGAKLDKTGTFYN